MNIRRTMLALGLLALIALAALAVAAPRAGHASSSSVEVQAITAGSAHNCALTTDGGLKCWGWNKTGQLGDGTVTTLESTLVDVSGLSSGVAAVAAGGGVGGSHTCALTTGGGLTCWGRNSFGQLGDGTQAEHASPVDVVGLAGGVAAVAAGTNHTCAVTTAGGVKCWGWNPLGQLGDGTTTSHSTPVDVCQDYDEVAEECTELLSGIAAVSAGGPHTCAVTVAGGVKCWGQNVGDQLGGPATDFCVDPFVGDILPCNTTPVDVCQDYDEAAGECAELLTGVAAVTAGSAHTCALTTDGGVKCWGANGAGQIGDGTSGNTRTAPVDVAGLESGVLGIDAGTFVHTCAVTTAGGVKCWGDNFGGLLGDGTTTDRATPVNVCQAYDTVAEECTKLLSGIAAVAAGAFHTCAVTTEGGVKCWGSNCCGQLGNGTSDFDPHPTPVDVLGLGPEPTPAPSATPAPTATSIAPPPPTPTQSIAVLLPATGQTGGETAGNPWLVAALAGAGGAAAASGVMALKRKEEPS